LYYSLRGATIVTGNDRGSEMALCDGVVLMCYRIEDVGEPRGRRPCRRASFLAGFCVGWKVSRPESGLARTGSAQRPLQAGVGDGCGEGALCHMRWRFE